MFDEEYENDFCIRDDRLLYRKMAPKTPGIWGLLNGENGHLVGKVELVLDDERTDDKAAQLIGCIPIVILQTFVVYLLVFSPRQPVAPLHPAVGIGLMLDRSLHLIEGQLSVQRYDFHVGWSSFNAKLTILS